MLQHCFGIAMLIVVAVNLKVFKLIRNILGSSNPQQDLDALGVIPTVLNSILINANICIYLETKHMLHLCIKSFN